MLRQSPPDPPLDAAERHGLSVLLDLSRLVTTQASLDVVELRIVGGGSLTLSTLAAAGWGIRTADGVVELQRDVLRLATTLAGAVAEQASDAADRHGRVPHSENDAVRAGLERDPIVNRMAVQLRNAVASAAGARPVVLISPWPDGRRWAMAMTHDLDVVDLWPAFTGLRVAELLKKAEIARVAQVLSASASAAFGDPVLAAARNVLAAERTYGIRSTWFIITGTPTAATIRAGDITYRTDAPRSRRILEAIGDAGHEFALHGSFATLDHLHLFVDQRERLTVIAQRPIYGVRQHFIRMRPGKTHRGMAAAGFQYDSTFGFSDRNGFRIGLADVTPVWDNGAGRALAIDEVPFVWMDRALSKYRGEEDPRAWIDDALQLAATCREVEGVWCGIWHPNLAPALGYPGAPEEFRRLCEGLARHNPWSATLGEIVRWRRARRLVHATADSTAGNLRLSVPAGAAALALEDVDGRPVPYTRA